MNVNNFTEVILSREEVVTAINEYLQRTVAAPKPQTIRPGMVEFRNNSVDGFEKAVVTWNTGVSN